MLHTATEALYQAGSFTSRPGIGCDMIAYWHSWDVFLSQIRDVEDLL